MKSISQSPIILLNSRFVAIVRGDVLVSAKKKKWNFLFPTMKYEMARVKLMITNQINSLPATTFFSCKTLRKSNLNFRFIRSRIEKLLKLLDLRKKPDFLTSSK